MVQSFHNVTILIPTLDEASNIRIVIEELVGLYKDIRVLIVDDDSDDGTAEIVLKMSSKQRNVRLLSRKGKARGLTASIIDGLRDARTDYVVVMDGDGQHPLATVLELVRLLQAECDVSVACRTSVPGWPFHRRLLSLGAQTLGGLRLLLSGSPSCSDVLSGFFGIRRNLALTMYKRNKYRFVPEGYKFLFDLLKCSSKDTRVCETGYPFGTRKSGSSKISSRQCVAFVKSLFS